MLGGRDKFGYGNFGTYDGVTLVTRTFTNLPEHTAIRITGTYHILDCVPANKYFFINIDSKIVFRKII